MPIPLGILAVAGAGGGAASDFVRLETTLISANTASVTFSNLNNYSAYKHLQLRIVARDNDTNSSELGLSFRFNSSATTYAAHRLIGNGSSVSSSAQTSQSYANLDFGNAGANAPANSFGVGIYDILDFSSTNKAKTIRAMTGVLSTTSYINLTSGLWTSTSAITSIEILPSNRFVSGSRLSLYGIK